jgi:hypothetical protein
MTNATDNPEEEAVAESPTAASDVPQALPVWLRASSADLVNLDFEAPIVGSQSADSDELGQQFRAAIDNAVSDGNPETPAARVFSMLTSAMGMHLKAKEPNEPYGPMVAWADGRRSATPSDFRGEPLDVLAQMAAHAKHPVLRARLADVCWLFCAEKPFNEAAPASGTMLNQYQRVASAMQKALDAHIARHEARAIGNQSRQPRR